MTRLVRNGFQAYLVGGSVRDLLLSRVPKDFDISTDARPGQIKKLFRNCRIIGRRFRLAHIFFRDNKIIEVSTFRRTPADAISDEADGAGPDGKRGDNTFGEPHEDAQRRDLTINGLFYDIQSFCVIDYVGGIADLRSGIVRTIGDPDERFREDPLRMIRAVRHAVQAGFQIEPATEAALRARAPLLMESNVSRLQDDIQKDLERGVFASVLRMQRDMGILAATFPELDSYLSTADPPGTLFGAAWVWQSLSRLDEMQGQDPNASRFRLAALFFPLLEKRLLDAFGPPLHPVQHMKETHLWLIECSHPIGVHRGVREDLKTIWSGWLRLHVCLSAGKPPIRLKRKPYFKEICDWARFHAAVSGESAERFDARLQTALAAGKETGNRRRKRRRKARGPR